MTDAAKSLQALNDKIRNAATTGNVEDLFLQIEMRRQFLDKVSPVNATLDRKLQEALENALHDNEGFLKALEGAVNKARTRGRDTLQARSRYTKTQSNP